MTADFEKKMTFIENNLIIVEMVKKLQHKL
jgi:hypothetical protein